VLLVGLALGLGMLATAFSVFNALVLRPLAVKGPYAVYSFLGWGERKGQYQTRPFSWSAFKDFRQRNRAFSDVLGLANVVSDGSARDHPAGCPRRTEPAGSAILPH